VKIRPHVLALAVGLAIAASSALVAQQPAAADAKLPFDPAVRTGTLPNGLTYYVRRNERPDNRVLLRLAVKAGSVDEEADQRGLAHLIEHMAFNGSAHFKPGELVATFEATGARLGPHVNAYTSFDETVYMLQLPTDSEGLVRQGFLALSDFAGRLSLDPAEIDKERGVVIEEWRGGLGAQTRVRDKQVPVLFHGSKYAERLPIGDPDVIRKAPPERLRAYYTKWYRPDRMAVVAVGDADPGELERAIRETFGDLKKPSAEPPPRRYPVPLHDALLVSVATDPEITQASVSIVRKRPREPEGTVADYRRAIVDHLVQEMVNERFDELSQKADARFLRAVGHTGALSADVATFTLAAGVEERAIADGLAALTIEAKRLHEHGFGAAELDRAKRRTLAQYERAFSERDKTESGSFAQEYVNHFLEGEPSPGIEYEYRLVQQVLPAIDSSEVAAAMRRLVDAQGSVVLTVAPQKADLAVPDEARLRETIASAEKTAVMPWAEAPATAELMKTAPPPADVVGRREIKPLGVTVVSFANGVEAWLKPTDFKNDQILFTLYAPGGASLAPPERYIDASMAPALVERSGLGGHSAVELERLLAGKRAGASPFVSLSTHGISGSAAPADFETGLQLLHLAFTAPGNDAEAFAVLKKQLDAAVINRNQNPAAVFAERVAQVVSSGHYTARPLTSERVAALDRNAMSAFYRDRFSSAAGFTFFMVGAFDVEERLPLVARYVGSLPSSGAAAPTFKDVGIRFPPALVREVVEKGREPRSQAVISFFADPPPDETEQARLSAATEVLEIALRDVMREQLGQTYTVSVGQSQPLPQRGAGRVAVSFTASPENVQPLVDRVLAEVARLQREPPSADLTTRAKETARRDYETALKQNGYWLGRLQSAHLLQRDPLSILTVQERIDALTPEVLHAAFKQYFPLDRYALVTLMPEKP
jgi:zinc protease